MLKENKSKKCFCCGDILSIDNFSKDKSKADGLQAYCKECRKVNALKYKRTKQGLCAYLFGNQKQNSKKRGHTPPSYTKQEIEQWLLGQAVFHRLYDKWVDSNYDKMMTPSIDRKNDSIGYTLDNIQLMTWQDNENKAHVDMSIGILNNGNPAKEVMQYGKNNELINIFHSTQEASISTGIYQSGISNACSGKVKSAGGFTWKYA